MNDNKHHPLCREINSRHNYCIVYCFCNVFKEYDKWLSEQPKSTPTSLMNDLKRVGHHTVDEELWRIEDYFKRRKEAQIQSTPTLDGGL